MLLYTTLIAFLFALLTDRLVASAVISALAVVLYTVESKEIEVPRAKTRVFFKEAPEGEPESRVFFKKASEGESRVFFKEAPKEESEGEARGYPGSRVFFKEALNPG